MKKSLITVAIILLVTPAYSGVDAGGAAYKRGDYASALREFRPLAEQGDAIAQFALGVMYANGEGVPQSDTEAVKWYRKSAEQGNADAQNNLGVMYKNGHGVPQSDTEAVNWYRKSAEQGDAIAQFALGVMYANGEGVSQSDTEAVNWYRKSAEQGNAVAQFNLGVMYKNGQGVPQSDTEAVNWYRKSAEQGVADAQFNLGVMYANGQGVPQNDTEAVKWWRKSAEQGDATAQSALGVMYDIGEGVPENDTEAVKWYRKSAEQGDAIAQFALGVMYKNGHGVPQNDTEAVNWYRKAAEQGNADAQNNLGVMYKNGHGVPQSDTEAVNWYRKSAEQGNAVAQFSLGVMYKNGHGVPQSDTEAVKWYRKAAEQGNARAQLQLGAMYANGEGVPQNDTEAVNWWRKSAEQGDATAQSALGKLYYLGVGVPTDHMLAYFWYSMADASGDNAASKARDRIKIRLSAAEIARAETLTAICRENMTDCPVLKGEAALADLQHEELPTAAVEDKIPPVIDIPSLITVDSDSPTVRGRITDNDEVAQLTVEGKRMDIEADGSFSFTFYVPGGVTTVRIEAIDKWGNRSEKVVELSREVANAAAPVFAALDPTSFAVKENKDAVALIIGIANYKRTAAAQYADRDANFFGDYARRKLGVPGRNIEVLTNERADRSDIIEAIRVWLPAATQAGKSDIYVFFAGHGLGSDDGKEIYLLPYNGVPDILEDTALLRSELFKSLQSVQPRSVTVFLDTCYSGTSRDATLMTARPVRLVAKQQSIPKGFTVFSAASMEQTAKMLPEAEHGLFSYYLMKGMEGAADANGDQQITAGELHGYVLGNATRLRRNQTPQLHGDAERVLVRW